MTAVGESIESISNAALALALFAIDPVGTGGIVLRAPWSLAQDRLLAGLQELLPVETLCRRMPHNIPDDRLIGGIDLVATLQTRRPVMERGLLAEVDGGVVVLSMAERLSTSTVAQLTAAIDLGFVVVERNGIGARSPARVGLVAFDEGQSDEEGLAPALRDRLAFHLRLADVTADDAVSWELNRGAIAAARKCLIGVSCCGAITQTLCEGAMSLGIDSVRAPYLALRVARASAALHGRHHVADADAVVASRLVLAPRATHLPASQPPQPEGDQQSKAKETGSDTNSEQNLEARPSADDSLLDVVLAAAAAALPAKVLEGLQQHHGSARRAATSAKAGAVKGAAGRGRPIGARRGEPRGRMKINVVETLRAAAPWQGLRQSASARPPQPEDGRPNLEVRRDDFRVTRFKHRTKVVTVFVVDASGSLAANRLAEAKGAVELLLAECYIRRDEVALIAFRGRGSELVLPPTRSLVRAKRCLAELPGGGGTPLASAINAAGTLVASLLRRGQSAVVVLLTDGRANVARDGRPGAAQAELDATAAARALRATRARSLVIDTSPRPRPQAERLAAEMGGRYLPLPYAGSRELSRAIQTSVNQLSA